MRSARDEFFAGKKTDKDGNGKKQKTVDEIDLADVKRRFPDLDPAEWADPPANTETERAKAATIARLVDRGYSPASAELTSRDVMRSVRDEWTSLTADGDADEAATSDRLGVDRGQNGGGRTWD